MTNVAPAAIWSCIMGRMEDPYRVHCFVEAQNPIYGQVRSELRQGHKKTDWMWFIFPQIEGLGHIRLAKKFAILWFDEANAYLRPGLRHILL